jgi:hypothetical protein
MKSDTVAMPLEARQIPIPYILIFVPLPVLRVFRIVGSNHHHLRRSPRAAICQWHYEVFGLPSVSRRLHVHPVCRVDEPNVLSSVNGHVNFLCCCLWPVEQVCRFLIQW